MGHPERMGAKRPLAALGLAALVAVGPFVARTPPQDQETPSAAVVHQSATGYDAADTAAMAEAIFRRHCTGSDLGFREEAVSRSGDTWTVTGYADTKDAAGGVLHRDVTVIFTCTGNGQYRVDLCRVG